MSGSKEKVEFSLKVMLNKDESKLIFVEADNHFVDVLLSFLTMPLGKIVKLLSKHYGDKAPAIGSLTSLYKGLQNLDSANFCTEVGKKMLMNPRNSSEVECRGLKLNVDDELTKYLICTGKCLSYYYKYTVTMYGYDSNANCSVCRQSNGSNFSEVPLTVEQSNAVNNAGVFTETGSFIILDDLRILPTSTAFLHSFISTGFAEMEGAKIKEVSFGFNQIMDLLKGSFFSKTPLSDIILKDRCSAALNPEPHVLFAPFLDDAVSESKRMTLKVMVQKSTNKILFGEAEHDLVDFLFSFLAIPLGGVASLLQGKTSLTNIDNLYEDVSNSIPDKSLKTPNMKDRLIKPKLGLHYLSSNQILPLEEETHPPLFYLVGADGKKCISTSVTSTKVSIISPRVKKDYVRGPRTYMVTDDLVVTEFSLALSFSMINSLNIPMSDVKQMDFLIGVPEGLRILKASLKSKSALTDALMKPMIKKEPKQEN